MYVMIGTFVAFLILPILMDRTNLYYGFLPGKPYRFIKSEKELSLDGRSFHFQFIDAREGVTTASCYDQPLDRKTELEGARGIDFFKDYLLQSVTDAGGKIDDTNGENISVELNAISFAIAIAMARLANLRVHGIVEFKVKTSSGEKSYCSHMTDLDEDSPISSNALVTRKTASRILVSGALRRAMDSFILDIQSKK